MDSLELFARIKNLPLVSSRLVEGVLSGNYRSLFKGPGLEFDEVREYAEGDDSRFIDWNVSSRMGQPYVKTFREEREMALFLVIDVSASLGFGNGKLSKQETVATLAALLAFSAVHNNDRVGAAFFSDRIEKWVPPRKGRNQIFRLAGDIMEVEPKGKGSDLALALRGVHESVKRRGICVIISDFRTAPCWREMSLVAKRHDVIAIRIEDPSDKDFPVPGFAQLRDPETDGVLPAFGASSRFRREYREFWETHRIYWDRECRRRGISTLTVSTDDDPIESLFAFFRRRRRR
ncbi:DUF58 domain-containing protein [Sediminispirochaeta bajacaliforniensis]|uniref:DUF58 domain-containing protein n=1 Tax=Sediminispirochaeta bajacaliforniensis TaxID=148 RepID=UPI000366527E|nr:DUF58 domain-containing protein [Sediminispirochaeta bajacaliforniensis]